MKGIDPSQISVDEAQTSRSWLASLMLRDPGRWSSRLGALVSWMKMIGRGQRRRFGRAAAGVLAGASGIALMAMLAGPLAGPVAAQSGEPRAVITVNNTTCTLVDAIKAANTNVKVNGCAAGSASGKDTIRLGGNVTFGPGFTDYYAYGDFNTTPSIVSPVIIDGMGFTISRDAAAAEARLFYVSNDGDLTLRNVTLENGNARYLEGDGGAVHSQGGPLTFDGVTVRDNTANAGGAIYSKGDVTISNSTFSGNVAVNDGQGYKGIGGVMFAYGEISVSDSTFEDNVAEYGGAIFASGGDMTVTGSTFSGNTTSGSGAGIYTRYNNVTIKGSEFISNTATKSGGGFYTNAVTATIESSTFTGNSSGSYGGGLYLYESMTTIRGITVTRNTSGDYAGGVFMQVGTTIIDDSVISENYSGDSGGGLVLYEYGTMTMTNSTVEGNVSNDTGGAMYVYGTAYIADSTIVGNESDSFGGAFAIYYGDLTLKRSEVSGNTSGYTAGAVYVDEDSYLDVIDSTLSDNTADDDGGAIYSYGQVSIVNSTLSGNTADGDGGAIYHAADYYLYITNSTIHANTATSEGGGVYSTGYDVYIESSIVSGNSAPSAATELYNGSSYDIKVTNSVIGEKTKTSAQGVVNVTFEGTNNVQAFSNSATPLAASEILDTTLADNGGPTLTHNLVVDSPAIDMIDTCAVDADQRGVSRPRGDKCDAGAVEYLAEQTQAFVSTFSSGTVDDIAYGPHDILLWNVDFGTWEKWFDGTAAGLNPTTKSKHNVNSIWISDTESAEFAVSFVQNQQKVGTLGKVDGYDILWWDGTAFSRWFEGDKVGLTVKTQEKIDALHVLPEAPAGSSFAGLSCEAYLLVSLQGTGLVRSSYPGPFTTMRVRGEDILGFCATNLGVNTTGMWEMVLDGSEVTPKLPPNSVNSISVSADGATVYATVRQPISQRNQVFAYDIAAKTASGPYLNFSSGGLTTQTDALQIVGELELD